MKTVIKTVLVIITALAIFFIADKFGPEWLNDGESNYNGVILLVILILGSCMRLVWKN